MSDGDRVSHRVDDRAAVAADLRRVSFLLGDLRAAERSDARTYFEKDLALTRPGLLRRVARMLEERLPSGCERLAAAEPAPIVLATALALRCDIPLLFVDTAAGTVSGDDFPGAETVLVTDVILSGATAAEQVAVLRAKGLLPVGVLALVDRERGGRAALEADGLTVRSLFAERELVTA